MSRAISSVVVSLLMLVSTVACSGPNQPAAVAMSANATPVPTGAPTTARTQAPALLNIVSQSPYASLTITGVAETTQTQATLDQPWWTPTAGRKLVILQVKVENIGTAPWEGIVAELRESGGRQTTEVVGFDTNALPSITTNPGESIQGVLYFEMPADGTPTALIWATTYARSEDVPSTGDNANIRVNLQ